MQVLIAVVDDLWKFAYGSLFGSVLPTKRAIEKEVQYSIPFTPKVFTPESNITPEVTFSNEAFKSGEQYFVGAVGAFLYSDPVIAYDSAIETLHYSQPVILRKIGGRWAEVVVDRKVGWVLKDILSLRAEDIYPQLKVDTVYDATDNETNKLRACIDDQFDGAKAGLPLQSAEFVTYKLRLNKRSINWPQVSSRLAGTWQTKLKGVPGVHMSITAKTGSIMEYELEDIGYLAFVEAVFPDNSIKISQVGIPDDGQYTERIMTQEEYRELKPVFIDVV